MRDSRLWKFLEDRYGARIRRRLHGNETGAAMLMAIMFVILAAMVSLILLAILAGQVIPYVKASQNTQAGYAAESGLQAVLSRFKASDSNRPTALSDSQYDVAITYCSVMPDTSTGSCSGSADASTATYAWVTSRSTGSYTRTIHAVYRFATSTSTTTGGTYTAAARLGMGFYAAAPYATSSGEPIWKTLKVGDPNSYITVDSSGNETGTTHDAVSGKDGDGIVYYATSASDGTMTDNYSDSTWSTNSMNPANQTCMVATTTVTDDVSSTITDGNLSEIIDLSKDPTAGTPIILLPVAYKADSGHDIYTYTKQCQSEGKYSKLNNWIYDADGSIRLRSNPTLCISGGGLSVLGTNKSAATLESCGNSYGPNERESGTSRIDSNIDDYLSYHTYGSYGADQADYYTDSDKKAQKAELKDPDSLLNKQQKWTFSNGFVNAGYYNKLSENSSVSSVTSAASGYDAGLPESDGFAVGGVQDGSGKTRFQVLVPSSLVDGTTSLSAGKTISSLGYTGTLGHVNAVKLAPRYLLSSGWDTNLHSAAAAWFDSGGAMDQATASFGQAGEAGHATHQLVNESSGYCLTGSTSDGADSQGHAQTLVDASGKASSRICNVGSGTFDPFCYKQHLTGQASTTGSSTVYCSVADNLSWKSDSVDYTEDETADGSGTTTKLWTYTSGTSSSPGGRMWYAVNSDGSLGLVSSESAATTFTRYNAKNTAGNAGTLQANGKCLTEVAPGDTIDGTAVYSGTDGHSMVLMETCGTTKDYRGRTIESQVWNAVIFSDDDDDSWGSGRVITTTTSSSSGAFLITKEE